MLRTQAEWNGIDIVSAVNHAAGYIVIPTGQIVYPTLFAAGEKWNVGVLEL